ncbi:MAG: hypothetical protein FJZ56_03940 [Chlamydiae bacterium]|nr:hypothetical protein [Chlamydiota bacterium]
MTMSIKTAEKAMRELLEEMLVDLTKAEKGNKTAAQRVRTKSITFAKVAKVFRKLSVSSEKKKLLKKVSVAPKTRRKR